MKKRVKQSYYLTSTALEKKEKIIKASKFTDFKSIRGEHLYQSKSTSNLVCILIAVSVTFYLTGVGLFQSSPHQFSYFFSQSLTYFADRKNNVPPQVNDGGSRFYPPQTNLNDDHPYL